MNCESALPLINAMIDREIEDGDRIALDAHLSSCADCQAAADALRITDANLTRALQSGRDSARSIVDSVTSSLETDIATSQAVTEVRAVDWRSLALALVAGFLLALVIFPPASHQQDSEQRRPVAQPDPSGPNPDPGRSSPHTLARIATVVASTGDVEIYSDKGDWSAVPLTAFPCSPDSRVRTSKGSLAELVTTDGAIIQMNGETEVRLRSPREVELQKGQVFCRAPDDVSIEVFSCEAPSSAPDRTTAWSAAGSGSGFLTALSPEGNGEVVSSAGSSVDVKTTSGRHQLKPGESASIVNGKVDQAGPTQNALLAASWIHPLLAEKGHDHPELNQRVDELLARLGRNKMSMLYEREIRSLGEYCVLPLIRYVQSPISRKEPGRRGSAIAIVADLAPSIAIGELLPLLRDESPEVRYQTARALLRLTGETHGRSPAAWREPVARCQETIDAWAAWWLQKQSRYPASRATSGKMVTRSTPSN